VCSQITWKIKSKSQKAIVDDTTIRVIVLSEAVFFTKSLPNGKHALLYPPLPISSVTADTLPLNGNLAH
jgi:hypothetical protein